MTSRSAMRGSYAERHSTRADGATLDDLSEAVTTLEEIEPTARRVLGGAPSARSRLSANLEQCASHAPRPRGVCVDASAAGRAALGK